MQLEAPITKVIALLTASIKEDTSSETRLQIEQVSQYQLSYVVHFLSPILFPTYILFFFNMDQLITMQAIDILKTTELYSPVFKEPGDPATDFIEALITVMLKRKILSFYIIIHHHPSSSSVISILFLTLFDIAKKIMGY